MKKTFSVILIALIAVTSLFANAIYEFTYEEGMERLVILNNAFDGLEATSQCYNAKEWHQSYSLKEIVEDNFWYMPSDDTECATGSCGDVYLDKALYGNTVSETGYTTYGFVGKYISFKYLNPTADYDLFVGPGQKESYECYYKNITFVGKEALITLDDDLDLASLYDAAALLEHPLTEAAKYTFVSVDGTEVTLSAKDALEAILVFDGEKKVDLAYGDNVLENVYYMIPEGFTAETDAPEGTISRLIVTLNAKGVYGEAPKYLQNRAGTYYPTAATITAKNAGSFSAAELFEKFGVRQSENVKVMSYVDGYARDEAWDHFTKKYIAWHAKNEFITLGQEQPKAEDSIWNIGYFICDQDAFAYIPADGQKVSTILETVDMVAPSYLVYYTDDTYDFVNYEEIADAVLTQDTEILQIFVL